MSPGTSSKIRFSKNIRSTLNGIFHSHLPIAPQPRVPPARSPSNSRSRSSSPTPKSTWSWLRTALRVLHQSAGVFPPLQSAVSTLISCLDVLESANDAQYFEELASELRTLSEILARYMKETKSMRMSDSMMNAALSIGEQAQLINEKRNRGTRGHLLKARIDEEDLKKYCRRIEALFRQLQADASLSIWSIANEHLVNTRLEGLAPAKMAKYNSKLSTDINRRTCTEGTRTSILTALDDWSHDSELPPLYWMNGMAGTGKTTIACSFSKSLDERKQLAASFFCTRASPECRDASRIVPTIAYQLARYSIPFQSALSEALGNDPDIGSANILEQLRRLLKEPLEEVKTAIPENLVVVIDALDECDNKNSVELILNTLFAIAADLPLRCFMTSRPNPEIYNKMISQSQSFRRVLHLHDIEKSMVEADIKLYIEEELGFIPPTALQVDQLARRCGNLFIYVATLVRYIQLGKRLADPHKRLQSVLAMTSKSRRQYAETDALYTAILESILTDEDLDSEDIQDIRALVQTALCIQEPVNIGTLAMLTGLNDSQRVLSALQLVRSVIYFSEESGLVSTLHASFPDFMFSRDRAGAFFCDAAEHNQGLARRCFEIMEIQLRFNICNLESSFSPDARVIGLDERIEKVISPELSYACRYWGDHLKQAANLEDLCELLNKFLSNRLLFWMEVMNLKRTMGSGAEILLKAILRLQSVAPQDLITMAEDSRNFVTSFAASAVSQSTPHLYISSLPFCPKSSTVFKTYWGRVQGLIEVNKNIMDRREVAALAKWKAESGVNSVAYSSDGTRIAYGCDDGTISLRNAYDGCLILGPFQAHNRMIKSVAFSPDGDRVVSGSHDYSVRVWSTRDATLLLEPLQGHTSWVTSVAFSPDGAYIASASADRTIRIWDAHRGTPIAVPFTGHTATVGSIAFSPDSTHIVSGSRDCTLRVWNVKGGANIAGPLKGHTHDVWAVAFSPDGTHVASGSNDCTIRVWDIRNGLTIAGPFDGHTNTIHSIAFSPDGARIVSASSDHTIRVSGAHDGTLVAGPFEGHSGTVWSAIFSPDGTRIVSGSTDRTIQIWGVRSGMLISDPIEGHSDAILSTAFSPDGARIISGSADHTVRMWGARDGMPFGGPLKGHSGRVNSVAFSPDGNRIVSGSSDCTIRVWNIQGGAMTLSPLKGHARSVKSVAFSPDGAHIVSGSDDQTVRVWNSQDGAPALDLEGHRHYILSVTFSPDSERIASGSADSTTRVWNRCDGTLVGSPFSHSDWVRSVAFVPDGTCIVSSSDDRTIRIWDLRDGTVIARQVQGHTFYTCSIAFRSDGIYAASGSSNHTIRAWDVRNNSPIVGPFQGHTDEVTSTAFSPDRSYIVSGSHDRTIRVWNLANTESSASPFRTPYSPSPEMKHWTIQPDGWITDDQSRLWLWVPLETSHLLPTSHNALVISPFGPLSLGPFGLTDVEYDNLLIGDRWNSCYIL
ncbi:hypothetical protein CTheo_6372 [Ceratobasidium theobromae]|uniref:NACHT domain-containing protein n=1 Tax=Ceratobasidium theobromae TaxID=1582974 RepID=A0A5N5QEY6_9AGAM|nr:hypothetical protein CTheo_6372 [Ceratobasidium theobromae]